MNLQKFRDLLRPIGDHFWPGRKVHDAPAFFWRRDAATYEALDQVSKAQIDEYTCHKWYTDAIRIGGPLPPRRPIQRLPFDRFILRIDDELTNETTWRLIVERPDVLFPDDVTWGLLDDEEHLVAISTEVPGCTSFDIWDTNRRAVRRDVDTHSLTMALFEEVLDWERQTDPNPKAGLELVMGWRRMKAVQLRPFLFELFHPANHVVKVMPPKSVRSVEWHEARSHYLILDRKAMAHVGPMAGKISEAESAEAIRRAAHRRRAHTRVLRHPKWGTRIGYIVHVKSAWIGPKQWEGPDGKTYVLMERKPGA